MPDPHKGRYATFKVEDACGNPQLVGNIGRWGLSFSLDEIDVTVFGSVWKKSVPGFQGWTASVEGFYTPGDTYQLELENAMLNATKIQDARFYYNTNSYWRPNTGSDTAAGCYIVGFNIEHDKAGVATLSMNVVGFGPIARY